MTTLVVILALSVAALAVAVVWLVARTKQAPTNFDDAFRQTSQRMTDLAAQLGRDSAFQKDLQQALQETRTAAEQVSHLKGERQSDLKQFHQKMEQVEKGLSRVTVALTGRGSGGTGENILRDALKFFPGEWIRSPFQIGGCEVEFGLVLADRKVIPIDSKFSGIGLVEQLKEAQDDALKVRLIRDIENLILKRAKEVAKYLDPQLTTPFAICAVPDSVHGVLKSAHWKAYQDHRIMLMPYSQTIPVLLALYQLSFSSGASLDEAQLEAYLSAMERHIGVIRRNLENRIKDAQVQLGNAYQECLQAIGGVEASMASLRSRPMPGGEEESLSLGVKADAN